LNTQPSTLVESEVAEMMVLARAKMKESESEMSEKMSSARAKMSSVTSKLPEMVPTAIDEVARGKGARPYASDDPVSKLKAKLKHFQVGKKVDCKRGAASIDKVADKTSHCYDHEVMKRRTTKPKSSFPKLQNNETSKYTYIFQSVSYLDKSHGYQAFHQVVNKSGADALAVYLKRFSKFGPKQSTDYLNTAKIKANLWKGLGDNTPYHCNEYPSAAFQCPTLAHFQCGPMTSDPLVRRYCLCYILQFVQ
jgi:hypothetical protein